MPPNYPTYPTKYIMYPPKNPIYSPKISNPKKSTYAQTSVRFLRRCKGCWGHKLDIGGIYRIFGGVVPCIQRIFGRLGWRFAAALLPRLFGTNPRSHHKGATSRVRTGDQRLPVLCHCQLGQDIPKVDFSLSFTLSL